MKTTGFVRRVDDLYRVVIPKEVRRKLRIKEGDPLEITAENGGIFLRKYSSAETLVDIAKEYLHSVCAVINCTAYVADQEYIIAASGELRENYLHKQISEEDNRVINEGITFTDPSRVIKPIIVDKDVIGVVGLIAQSIESRELAIAEIAAEFLAKQLAC